jgi:hypothetical protein
MLSIVDAAMLVEKICEYERRPVGGSPIGNFIMVRVERIELSSLAWKAGILATIRHPRVLTLETLYIIGAIIKRDRILNKG